MRTLRARWSRRTFSLLSLGLTTSCLLLLCAQTAHADDGIGRLDVERFRPSVDGNAGFAVTDATVPRLGQFSLHLSLHNAFSPLVLMRENGEQVPLVSNRLSGVVSGIVGLGGPVALGLSIPITLFQSGSLDSVPSSLRPGGSNELGVAGIGDLLLSPRIGLLREERQGIDLSLDGSVAIPTGRTDAFQGDGGFGGMVSATLARTLGSTRLMLLTGARFRPSGEVLSVPVGHELVIRFAAIQRLGVGNSRILPRELIGELDVSTLLVQPFEALTTPGEWRVGARICPASSLVLTVGGGGGMTPAYGTPFARAMLSFGWDPRACSSRQAEAQEQDLAGLPLPQDEDAQEDGAESSEESPEDAELELEELDALEALEAKDSALVSGDVCEGEECEDEDASLWAPGDSDGDGIPDDEDACPEVPGLPEFQGCPPPDRDGDGVWDNEDFCPDLPGPASSGGCPPLPGDADGDGVPDAEDRCPNQAGPAESFGCPLVDSDGDGLYDHEDNCPAVPGPERFRGCPTPQLVELSGRQIELLEPMLFIPNTPQLDRDSGALLEDLAAVILAHPELPRIQIEGHLDDSIEPEDALDLSQARAESVLAALTDRGVEAHRLVAVGRGSQQPIASNMTPRGRRSNRRIELWIVGRDVESQELERDDNDPLDLLDLELSPLLPLDPLDSSSTEEPESLEPESFEFESLEPESAQDLEDGNSDWGFDVGPQDSEQEDALEQWHDESGGFDGLEPESQEGQAEQPSEPEDQDPELEDDLDLLFDFDSLDLDFD